MNTDANIAESRQALCADIARRRDSASVIDRQRAAADRELPRLDAELVVIDQKGSDAPAELAGAGTPA